MTEAQHHPPLPPPPIPPDPNPVLLAPPSPTKNSLPIDVVMSDLSSSSSLPSANLKIRPGSSEKGGFNWKKNLTSSGESEARVPNTEGQDATMIDVGERDRKPGDPPDARGEWVAKVVGSSTGGRLRPELVLDDDFVEARMDLKFPNGKKGEPEITIGEEVLKAMNGLWKNCMIVKVLGKNFSIATVSRKLRELWKPKGTMSVVDLPRQFFMVRFELEEEYFAALSGGPWRVFGYYLMVQAWSPDFDPLRDEITTTPVWIRLLDIPVNFYHRSIIMGIAKGLGKPVRVDQTTLNLERARFARVCVAVDLREALQGTVKVNGSRYFVAYEGLTEICSYCGVFGHLVHKCPHRVQEIVSVAPPTPVVTNQVVVPVQTASTQVTPENDGYTSVRRNGRKPEKIGSGGGEVIRPVVEKRQNLRDITHGKDSQTIEISNRFGSLVEVTESSGTREDAVMVEENKEKENLENIVVEKKSTEQAKGLIFGAMPKGGDSAGRIDRRAGTFKPTEKTRPRPKFGKGIKLGRGLILSPAGGDNELSSNGKRLRVDQEHLGRPGGMFTTGELENGENPQFEQTRDTEMNKKTVRTEEITERTETEMQMVLVTDSLSDHRA